MSVIEVLVLTAVGALIGNIVGRNLSWFVFEIYQA